SPPRCSKPVLPVLPVLARPQPDATHWGRQVQHYTSGLWNVENHVYNILDEQMFEVEPDTPPEPRPGGLTESTTLLGYIERLAHLTPDPGGRKPVLDRLVHRTPVETAEDVVLTEMVGPDRDELLLHQLAQYRDTHRREPKRSTVTTVSWPPCWQHWICRPGDRSP